MRIPAVLLCMTVAYGCAAAELRVVCTVPDLADMIRDIGGDAVTVDALVRSGDNPHFITARPSYIRKLASADAFVVVGMDLEVGWAPALLRSARNRAVQPGAQGYIDCSKAIKPMEVPDGTIDRSLGDVHPHGNPHYLLSPMCGIQVITFLGERLAAVDATRADHYRSGAERTARALATALYGEALVEAHTVAELVAWHESGKLQQQVEQTKIGGWLATMAPVAGSDWIDDHAAWPYLAHCYDFRILAHLEPKAGVPPSSSHLKALLAMTKKETVSGIISAPWFDPRHAQQLAQAASLPIIPLAHQVGALPGTDSYVALCEQHVSALSSVAIPAKADPEL